MEPTHRQSVAPSGLADRNARAPTPVAEPVRTAKSKTSKKEEAAPVAEDKPAKVKFAKGSEEAKAHMAALRAKRGAAPKSEKVARKAAAKEEAAPSQEAAPAVKRVKGKKVAEEAPAPVVAKPKKKKIVQVEIEVSDSE